MLIIEIIIKNKSGRKVDIVDFSRQRIFSRCEMVVGAEAMEKLAGARVAVFGVGGVGGYVVEALVRSGVGSVDIFDKDVVSPSNINRQIIALCDTVGLPKVEVMAQRAKKINPCVNITPHRIFYLPENSGSIDLSVYDYVADAVDTVSAKLEIISRCKDAGVRVISAMGAGNKMDPTAFKVADISKTSVCPLARVMRRELKKRGIKNVKVVYSTEEAIAPLNPVTDAESNKAVPGSFAFVPSVMGLIMGGEIVKDIIAGKENTKASK